MPQYPASEVGPVKKGRLALFASDPNNRPFKDRPTHVICSVVGHMMTCFEIANAGPTDNSSNNNNNNNKGELASSGSVRSITSKADANAASEEDRKAAELHEGKMLLQVDLLLYNHIAWLPHTVEEGVERLRLKRKNPRAVKRFQLLDTRARLLCFDGWSELERGPPVLTFMAENMTDAKVWAKAMKAAMFWAPSTAVSSLSFVSMENHATPADVELMVKIMLPQRATKCKKTPSALGLNAAHLRSSRPTLIQSQQSSGSRSQISFRTSFRQPAAQPQQLPMRSGRAPSMLSQQSSVSIAKPSLSAVKSGRAVVPQKQVIASRRAKATLLPYCLCRQPHASAVVFRGRSSASTIGDLLTFVQREIGIPKALQFLIHLDDTEQRSCPVTWSKEEDRLANILLTHNETCNDGKGRPRGSMGQLSSDASDGDAESRTVVLGLRLPSHVAQELEARLNRRAQQNWTEHICRNGIYKSTLGSSIKQGHGVRDNDDGSKSNADGDGIGGDKESEAIEGNRRASHRRR